MGRFEDSMVGLLGGILWKLPLWGVWAILRKDIQGAFGISAWVTIGGSTLALFAISLSRL